MSGPNTFNNSLTGTIGGLGSLTNAGGLTQGNYNQWQLANQVYPTMWTSTGTTFQSPIPLTPETAKDLMAQLEHDKVLVADHKLLFGQYMGKSLREVPLEYIVQLGAAMRGARIQVAKELRRRRALERLTKH